MSKIVELTWEDVLSRIDLLKKKYRIDSKTKVYGVPRNGMILAGFFGCKNVTVPEDADIILDDIIDSGQTRKRYKKLYPRKKFITLFEKDKDTKWVHFPFEQHIDEDHEDTVVRFLQIIGEDPNREGLKKTPRRYLDTFREFLNPPEFNMTTFSAEETDEMIVQLDIPFYSFCEHHLLPFFGKGYIAYIPDKKIVGLSKLARTLEVCSRKLQNQERITTQVADALVEHLKPLGAAVIIEASHGCMGCRGVKKSHAIMSTSAMRGVFFDKAEARSELMQLIKN